MLLFVKFENVTFGIDLRRVVPINKRVLYDVYIM